MQSYSGVLIAALMIGAGSFSAVAQDAGEFTERPVSLSHVGAATVSKTNVQVFGTQRVDGPFNGVVVQARATAAERKAWVRFVSPSSDGEWLAMTLLQDPSDPIFLAAYHGDFQSSKGGFEIAIGPGALDTKILSAGVFDTQNDEDQQTVTWDPGLSKVATASGRIIPPKLHTRAEWGANPFIGTPIALARPDYDKMTFHHTAGWPATTLEEGLERVKAIQDFHQSGRGWSDIGYHFLIDQSGRIYQGRPFLDESIPFEDGPPLAQGAHVGGANTGNIGVSALGCFHPPEGGSCTDMLSAAAQDSLVTLFAYLSDTYGVKPSILRGHRDYSSTACPGDNNYALIPGMRGKIADLVETGNEPVGVASLIATVGDNGVVALDWQFLSDFGIQSMSIERRAAGSNMVLFSADAAIDMSITDTGVFTPGEVVYLLFATNGAGRRQQIASAQVDVQPPSDFSLFENFPNPFSDRTTIRYFLTEDGFVNLRVIDASGRLVDELANSFQQKGRWYTEHFDGGTLSAGLYLYRITVEGFAGTIFDQSGTLVLTR